MNNNNKKINYCITGEKKLKEFLAQMVNSLHFWTVFVTVVTVNTCTVDKIGGEASVNSSSHKNGVRVEHARKVLPRPQCRWARQVVGLGK